MAVQAMEEVILSFYGATRVSTQVDKVSHNVETYSLIEIHALITTTCQTQNTTMCCNRKPQIMAYEGSRNEFAFTLKIFLYVLSHNFSCRKGLTLKHPCRPHKSKLFLGLVSRIL